MHLLVHDGPADEVEPLRLHQLVRHAIDVVLQSFCIDAIEESGVAPHFLNVGYRACVGHHDAVHDALETACRRAFGAIDVVRLIADGVGTVVVLESEVKVPDRFNEELRVVTVFEHVGAPVGIGVARQFPYKEMPMKTGQIEVLPITQLRVFPVAFVERILEGIVVLLDVIELYRQDILFVGVLDGNRSGARRSEVLRLLRGVGVNLDKVAASQFVAFRTSTIHFRDVDTIIADLDSVA